MTAEMALTPGDDAPSQARGRYALTPEHEALRQSIRKLVDRHVRPIAEEIDETDRFPEELVPIFGDMGLLQMWVPEEYGGPGGDLTSVCIAREEISRISEACALLAGQNSMGLILPLITFGTEEQRRTYLPEVAKGRTLTAVAITEPEAGSDVAAMKTHARRDGTDWIISGQKIYITMGSVADFVLVFARTSPGKGYDGISAFIVDTTLKGFQRGREERKMGLKGCPNTQLFFEDVRVPGECLVGEEGKGFRGCMQILDLNRPTVGACSVGLAAGAFEYALEFAKERKQFGRRIADFQGIQFMLAEMATQIEAARCLVYEVARAGDNQERGDFGARASMAKMFASDVAMKVTTDALQVLGGAGYMKDHPVERFMRDAKINQIFEGTNQIQRLIISRHLIT
mgnify:CR=1 FL=1